jgi:hypothetical protein
MSTIKKPHPDAIQTIYGWALPKTGEILVSKRGLPNPVDNFKIGKQWIPTPIKQKSKIDIVSPKPEIAQEAESVNVQINTPEDLNKVLGGEIKQKRKYTPKAKPIITTEE